MSDEQVEPTPSASEREELEAELLERREAALAHVVKFGDPVLKSKASPVADFGPELRAEVERMIAIMRDGMGVGLAATQLGVLRRLLVFQAGPDGEPTALVNPEIEWLSDEVVVAEEGCLSLPRVSMDVERPLHARVSGRDVEGEPIAIEASGLEARVLQHEIDHLDGVLILDRTTRDQRKGALRALREGGSYSPPPRTSEAERRRASTASRAPTREDRLPRHLRLRRHRPAAAWPARRTARRWSSRRPTAARGRGRKQLAAAGRRGGRASSGSSCCRPRTSTSEAALERIRAAEPEAVVVCAFGQLIREPLLSELPMLNVHPSLLPRWRGAAPIERAIMAGDERTGVCVMRLTAGLDSGPVALREEVAIGPDEDFEALSATPGGARRRAAGPGPRPRRPRAGSSSPSRTTAAATYAEKIDPAERRLDPARPAAELAADGPRPDPAHRRLPGDRRRRAARRAPRPRRRRQRQDRAR